MRQFHNSLRSASALRGTFFCGPLAGCVSAFSSPFSRSFHFGMIQHVVPEQFPLSVGSRYWVHHSCNPSTQLREFGGAIQLKVERLHGYVFDPFRFQLVTRISSKKLRLAHRSSLLAEFGRTSALRPRVATLSWRYDIAGLRSGFRRDGRKPLDHPVECEAAVEAVFIIISENLLLGVVHKGGKLRQFGTQLIGNIGLQDAGLWRRGLLPPQPVHALG